MVISRSAHRDDIDDCVIFNESVIAIISKALRPTMARKASARIPPTIIFRRIFFPSSQFGSPGAFNPIPLPPLQSGESYGCSFAETISISMVMLNHIFPTPEPDSSSISPTVLIGIVAGIAVVIPLLAGSWEWRY
jgi:hypothetical protein